MSDMSNASSSGNRWLALARQREYGVGALLLLTVLLVSVANPRFRTVENFSDMLVNAVPAAIIGCGMTLVIVTGEIDISVGSLMGLLAAIMGVVASPAHWGQPPWVSIPIVLLAGTIVGCVTGGLVTYGGVPSIIVTLGMLTALRGATQLVMKGNNIDMPESLFFLGKGSVVRIPMPPWLHIGEAFTLQFSVLTAIVVVLAFIVLTRMTPLGLRVYAVGSNKKSAHLAGISERRIKILVFTLTGLLTAVATLVGVTRLPKIEQGIGVNLELLVVTCVVVGGTSINGGRGNIIGSILAVFLLTTIGSVLIFLSSAFPALKLGTTASYWERAIQGAFILLAVLVDHLARGREEHE